MFLRSHYLTGGSAAAGFQAAILDSIFSQLAQSWVADLDHDGDTDQNHFSLMVNRLGGTFPWP